MHGHGLMNPDHALEFGHDKFALKFSLKTIKAKRIQFAFSVDLRAVTTPQTSARSSTYKLFNSVQGIREYRFPHFNNFLSDQR